MPLGGCYLLNPDISFEPISGYPWKTVREARKLGLLPEGKSFEAERERMKPLERNERVFKG